MSLFSASLKIQLKNEPALEGFFGYRDGGILMTVHRGYRNEAREMVDLIQKAISRSRVDQL